MTKKELSDRGLTILFITPWYPTDTNNIGGIFVQEYAKAVQKFADVNVLHFQGSDPHLEASWQLKQTENEKLWRGIRTYQLAYRRAFLPKVSVLMRAWALIQCYRQINRNGFSPDIIHAHVFRVALPVLLLSKLFRLPLIISEHSSNFQRRTLSKSEQIEVRLAYRRADYVLPVSRALQKAIEAYKVRATYRVVPNVVDTTVFYYRERSNMQVHQKKRFLSVGIMHDNKIKGIALLIHAFAQLKGKQNDCELILIGDGPAREKYKNLVHKLEISQNVHFLGAQSKVEIAQEMHIADTVVISSLYETFSVVAAEALCCGTPVLSTRCGGPESFVTNEVGLLVERDDILALCDGLDFMANHADTFNRRKIATYASSLFSREAISQQLNEIYHSVL